MTEEYLETASALCVCVWLLLLSLPLFACLFLSLGLSQMSSDIFKNPHKKYQASFFFSSFSSFHLFLQLLTFLLISTLNGGWRCLMSTPCPESWGSHLILLSCLFSCSSNCCCCSSCHFYTTAHFFWLSAKTFSSIFLFRNGMFCMAVVEYLGDNIWYVLCVTCCHMALVFAIIHHLFPPVVSDHSFI